jgi:hypothetical protein
MPINYIEKGTDLHQAIGEAGYRLIQIDGVLFSNNDDAVQAIIDSFNPLPLLQKEYIDLVNKLAGETRVKYVTNVPFQEAAYQMKEADTRRYKADDYPADLTLYPFTAFEADATGLTPTQAADLVIEQADQWVLLSAMIEGLRRKATVSIEAVTDWQQVSVVAQSYIAQLEQI